MLEHGSSQKMQLFHLQSQESLEYIICFTDGVQSLLVTTKVKYGHLFQMIYNEGST